jgi:Phosphopantetheine attachment site
MTRVHALLSERLGRDLPVVDLFRYPTVASLAAHLASTARKDSHSSIKGSTIT